MSRFLPFNEEATIAAVIREILRQVTGIDCVKVPNIADRSTDRTADIAHDTDADTAFALNYKRGLSFTFQAGMGACLWLGSDIIVNTDAGNQYPREKIALFVQPIVAQRADIVIGDRLVDRVQHFPPQKRGWNGLATRPCEWCRARVFPLPGLSGLQP